MTGKHPHNNPWAEKLQQVSIPGADDSWIAMAAILDTEMPSGPKKDGRRWLLLVILLLLLIGICNCPGWYRREGGMGAMHHSEVSALGPEKKEWVAGKVGSDAEKQGSGAGKKAADAGKQGSDSDKPGSDAGKQETDAEKIKRVRQKEGEPEKKIGEKAPDDPRKQDGHKRQDEKDLPGVKENAGDRTAQGVKKDAVDKAAPDVKMDARDRTATPVKKKAEERKDPDRKKKPEEGEDPDKKKTPEGEKVPDSKKNQDAKKTPDVQKETDGKKIPDGKKAPDGNKAPGSKKTPDAKKSPDGKKSPDAKKTPERDSTERGWTVGLGINQFFTIGGQEKSNYNSGGTTGGLSDYIPVPVIRYYFNPKLFLQLEAQFNAPQYTKKDLVVSQPPLDTLNPAQYHQTSVQVKKLFYLNLPLSIHYSPFPDFYIGTGLQYSRLSNGIGLFEDKSFARGSTDTLKSARTQSFKGDSTYQRIKTQEFRLLLDLSYNYKKFVLGLRYNRALSNFINIRISATQISQSRNSSLQLYLRYNFWDSRKKRR